MDVADPLHPFQVCGLSNVTGGRFISATRIAFWYFLFLGVADLQTGSVNWSRAFASTPPFTVAFNGDGTTWAYQTGDETNTGVTTHLVVAGKDKTILTRRPVGGHGGVPYGPLFQLEFSPGGQYLLTYTESPKQSERPNFIVFAMDGSVAFQSATANFGVWDKSSNRLYFLAAKLAGDISGQVSSWDPGGGPVIRSRALTSFFWPTMAPDGRTLAFNSYDPKGFPKIWRLDIASGGLTQVSKASSTIPVFVGPGLIWSSEEKPYNGGLGVSAPDGKVLAHDLQSGTDTLIADFTGFTPSQTPTRDILDVWLG
jgi:WD40-like Beta Propeller Repeat